MAFKYWTKEETRTGMPSAAPSAGTKTRYDVGLRHAIRGFLLHATNANGDTFSTMVAWVRLWVGGILVREVPGALLYRYILAHRPGAQGASAGSKLFTDYSALPFVRPGMPAAVANALRLGTLNVPKITLEIEWNGVATHVPELNVWTRREMIDEEPNDLEFWETRTLDLASGDNDWTHFSNIEKPIMGLVLHDDGTHDVTNIDFRANRMSVIQNMDEEDLAMGNFLLDGDTDLPATPDDDIYINFDRDVDLSSLPRKTPSGSLADLNLKLTTSGANANLQLMTRFLGRISLS